MEFYHLPGELSSQVKVIFVAKLLDVEAEIALVNVRSCLTLDWIFGILVANTKKTPTEIVNLRDAASLALLVRESVLMF